MAGERLSNGLFTRIHDVISKSFAQFDGCPKCPSFSSFTMFFFFVANKYICRQTVIKLLHFIDEMNVNRKIESNEKTTKLTHNHKFTMNTKRQIQSEQI